MDAEKQDESNIHIPQIKQMKIVEERKGGESRILSLTFIEVSEAQNENDQFGSSFSGLVWRENLWFPKFSENEFHTISSWFPLGILDDHNYLMSVLNICCYQNPTVELISTILNLCLSITSPVIQWHFLTSFEVSCDQVLAKEMSVEGIPVTSRQKFQEPMHNSPCFCLLLRWCKNQPGSLTVTGRAPRLTPAGVTGINHWDFGIVQYCSQFILKDQLSFILTSLK